MLFVPLPWHDLTSTQGMVPAFVDQVEGDIMGDTIFATVAEEGFYGLECAPQLDMAPVALTDVRAPPRALTP